jgi:signal transduction histidine kinase
VCWQIVQQLRGSISADSSDAGTRFVVTLPVSPPAASAA